MNNEEKILTLLEQMNTRLGAVEAGLVNLEAGQANLEAGQAKLEAGLVNLEARQTKLESEIGYIRDISEAIKRDSIQLLTVTMPLADLNAAQIGALYERVPRLERLERIVEEHDHQLYALREAVMNKI